MRIGLFEPFDVGGFVVWDSVLPAAKDDSLPLVSQSSFGHLRRCAFIFKELVVRRRPTALLDRKSRVFVEGLPKEFRASPAAGHERLLAALGRERRDARGRL